MKSPAVMADNIAAAIAGIPELADFSVSAYHDAFPERSNVLKAIMALATRAILIVYQGTDPARRNGSDVWKHEFSAYIMGGSDAVGAQIINGVPAGGSERLIYAQIDPDCYPMDLPRVKRLAAAEAHDYFEVRFTLTEYGDY